MTENPPSNSGNVAAAQSDAAAASGDSPVDAQAQNPVKQTVNAIVTLLADIHELKEELKARGIQFHTINVMVELGTRNKTEEQKRIRDTALEASRTQYGPAAITEVKLDEHLTALVSLERELGRVRRAGKELGLELPAMNSLALMMRQNPGDGGEQAINNILAYAMAWNIPLHRDVKDTESEQPELDEQPQAERVTKQDIKRIGFDICLGVLFAGSALLLLT